MIMSEVIALGRRACSYQGKLAQTLAALLISIFQFNPCYQWYSGLVRS